MQRNTGNTESITVEYGFLDSKGDDVNQLKNNWRNYAEAVVRAIVEYLNLTYIPIEDDNYYTVKSGDSLWSIAKKNNVSVANLKSINGLSSNILSIGQVLKIPIDNNVQIKENTYIVKSGDTLYKIAQNYGVTVGEIIQLNNLTNTSLKIGQVIEIPTNIKTIQYKVVSGDTLYKIAQDNNTTVDEIKRLNNLTNNILSIGQILNLPMTMQSDIYIVKSGDTLYKIAQDSNTTIDEIKRLNNLTNNILSIGQALKIK